MIAVMPAWREVINGVQGGSSIRLVRPNCGCINLGPLRDYTLLNACDGARYGESWIGETRGIRSSCSVTAWLTHWFHSVPVRRKVSKRFQSLLPYLIVDCQTSSLMF